MTSAVIGSLRVNLSADTAEFKRNLNAAERTAERFGRAIGSTLRTGAVALAAGVTTAATAIGVLTKKSFETISAQVDLAKRVGASVAAIQTLQYAAELSGASQEALAKTLDVLNARLGEAARTGAGPAYEALQRLGLSARELSEMDADVRIKTLSDRMAELHYSTQQQSDTLKNLGVRQQEINNLFIEGSANIDAARAELTAWGVILSDVDAAKVEAAGDAWDKLQKILTGVGNKLAIRIAPVLQDVAKYLGDASTKSGGFGSAIDDTIEKSVKGFEKLRKSIIQDIAWIEVFQRRMQLAGDVIAALKIGEQGRPDFQGIRDAHTRAATDIKKIWEDMEEKLGHLKGPEALLKGLDDYLDKLNPLVQNAPRGLETLLAGLDKRLNMTKPPPETGGSGEGDDGNKDAAGDTLHEQLAQRLATLQESLFTEREAEMANYQQRLADLAAFEDNKLLSMEEYADLRGRIEADLASNLKAIDDDVIKNQLRNAERQRQIMFGVAEQIGSALQGIFGESKAVAMGQALINTAQAVTRNLAEYPGPLGFAAAAAAAAAGAAQIAAIRSTSAKGGGGATPVSSGGGGSSNASGGSAPAPGSNQTLYINGLSNDSMFSGESVRELAAKLIEFQRDGGKVILAAA